ncbi:hypothetical protein [Bifidobacterium sp.]|uniref:hypothetical protein n=1 Tax=Bifidobacterium sp. TaxID=41200 RepID=UPI0025BD4651|nr:hypothetical protein [Bifidobacterium sp.]MCH4209804.1 hypothetical protein [Bifidobacterium sp.]
MTFRMQDNAIARISILPEVREAAQTGARLISLWPLSDAKQLGNDAKYAETLQVRVTRVMAAVMTGEEVTIPDAEFVYEGASEIPGRPQIIVEALLAANDACDAMSDYSRTGDTTVVMGAAGSLNVDWDEKTVTGVAQLLVEIENAVAVDAVTDEGDAEGNGSTVISADIEAVSQRLATMLIACDGLIGVIEDGADPALAGDDSESHRLRACRALPVILYANELCERLSIPRIFITDQQFVDLIVAHDESDFVMARTLAPLAAAEWSKHRDEVLWDPQEAKKKAKEEDERKNKEALAAKFANAPKNA